MNTVQFVDQVKAIRITKTMPVPKKGHTIEYWLKAACKLIPEIPNPFIASPKAIIEFQQAFLEYVRFDLRYVDGHRVYVVILRNSIKEVA